MNVATLEHVGRKNGDSLTRNRRPFAYIRAVLHNDQPAAATMLCGSSLYHNPWHEPRGPSNYFRHRAPRNGRKNLNYWLFVNRIVCQQPSVGSLYQARVYTFAKRYLSTYLPIYLQAQRSFNSTQFPFVLPFCRDNLPMPERFATSRRKFVSRNVELRHRRELLIINRWSITPRWYVITTDNNLLVGVNEFAETKNLCVSRLVYIP